MSGSLIMVGGNMAANAVNYLYHLVMGRVLGPVNYGILASLYSILYLTSTVSNTTGVAIVKFISASSGPAETFSIYKSLQRFILRVALAAFLILLISSPTIAKFLRIESLGAVMLIGPVLFFSLITLVNQATAQGLLKFVGSVGPNMVSAVLKLAVGLGLVLIGRSVFGAMTGVVVGAILAYWYSAAFIKRILPEAKEKSFRLKAFLVYTLPVLVQALSFTSFYTVDVILVKHFFLPFEAGIYAALSTLGKIIFFAASPITATMFPIVSGRAARGEKYQKVFLVALGVTLTLSLAIIGFYWLFPNIAIGILYGQAYLSAKAELVWMGAFMLFYTLSYLLVNFSLSLGKTKVIFLPLVAALIQVPALWFCHANLLQVIQISLSLAVVLFFVLLIVLSYNRLPKTYGKNK